MSERDMNTYAERLRDYADRLTRRGINPTVFIAAAMELEQLQLENSALQRENAALRDLVAELSGWDNAAEMAAVLATRTEEQEWLKEVLPNRPTPNRAEVSQRLKAGTKMLHYAAEMFDDPGSQKRCEVNLIYELSFLTGLHQPARPTHRRSNRDNPPRAEDHPNGEPRAPTMTTTTTT
jgi:hypothetical protein